MWKKFKKLKTLPKIIVGIIAFIFMPITFMLLAIEFFIKSIKNKKVFGSIVGLILSVILIFFNVTTVIAMFTPTDPEVLARMEAEQKTREEQEAKEKAAAEQKAKEEQEAKKKAEAEQKAKEEQEARKKAEAEQKAKEEAEFAKSDLGILTRKNHPTYYGSIKQAQNIWNDIDKNKIIINNGFSSDIKDNTILYIGNSERNSDLIKYVEIYFNKFSTSKPSSLDEVLKIASEYIPSDIIKKYYTFNYSYKIKPKEDKTEPNYYVISYHLTKKGKEEYNKNELYAGTIDIIIEQNKNKSFNSMSINFGTPKWMEFLDKNGYKKEEWNCDLTKL